MSKKIDNRTEFPEAMIDTNERYYTPFVDAEGRVGYRVTSYGEGCEECFVYFNPSDGPSDRDVFIYIGHDEQPDPTDQSTDEAVCFIDVGKDWLGLSEDQKASGLFG